MKSKNVKKNTNTKVKYILMYDLRIVCLTITITNK